MAIGIVNEINFQEEVIEKGGPAMIIFSAVWCGPCKQLSKVVESIMPDLETKITIRKVMVDDSPKLSNDFGVRSIPTTIFMHNGEEVSRIMGSQNQRRILTCIDQLFAKGYA